MGDEESEYGRGLLVCLLAFLNHKSRIEECAWMAEKTGTTIEDPTAFYAQLWANGASDHLYELEIPARLAGTDLARRLLKFKDKWLEIGHGLSALRDQIKKGDRPLSFDTVRAGLGEAEVLCLEVAAELDKILGLDDARVGTWP